MKKKKQVYVPMAIDILHTGHINIIQKAQELGDVTIGLLTDEAIINYKRLPLFEFEERKKIAENIKGVKSIVVQEIYDYEPILKKLKPDYLVHGDDWKTGAQSKTREKVKKVMSEWGGELIEPPFTDGVSSTKLIKQVSRRGITNDARRKLLRRLLSVKPLIRLLEAHNGLTGLIVEEASVNVEGRRFEFEGIWESSLTDSTSKGKPDIELVDFSSRFSTIEEILEVTSKPIIVDGDTGGMIDHFSYKIKTLERAGVSAIIIEDKIGSKRNSLFGTDVKQEQDTIENFSLKISEGKKSQVTDDFMIIARVESLILKQGMKDAINRAKAYAEAGADGIMIHSKETDGKEIVEFCNQFNKLDLNIFLVVVPSAYSHIREKELQDLGVNIVIYANHLLRSAYPNMLNAAKSILKNNRAKEASDEYCMSIKDIINLIPAPE